MKISRTPEREFNKILIPIPKKSKQGKIKKNLKSSAKREILDTS